MDSEALLSLSRQFASWAEIMRINNEANGHHLTSAEELSMRLIYTRSDLVETFNSMLDRASDSIDALDCGYRSEQAETQSRSQPAALTRGVEFRVVYDPLVFKRADLTRAMLDSVRQGENARVTTKVSSRLLIRDREEFLIQTSSPTPGGHLAVQLTSPVLADFINDAFTNIWDTALQICNRKFESGKLLEDDEIEILRLLAAGQKDESVSRVLGVSVRTVQRKIQSLQRSFGAASRFQLGATSAQHLLVDDPDND